MRTITAPGVEIKEIDKSQYSPAMAGTNCYVLGFAPKGEPYIPMEFTSRSSLQLYYGTPETEAERYFYNAAVEVINNNGRLFTARLPYDNTSFEKMPGVKYNLDFKVLSSQIDKPYSLSDTLTGEENEMSDLTAIANDVISSINDFAEKYSQLSISTITKLDQESEVSTSFGSFDDVNSALRKIATAEFSENFDVDYTANLVDVSSTDSVSTASKSVKAALASVNTLTYCKEKKNALYYVNKSDKSIDATFEISESDNASCYDLSAIDEYRTGENRVAKNTFLIVDTTGASYGKVQEDTRKGTDRDLIGIIPVVTTAANALYAQSMLTVDLGKIHLFENLKEKKFSTLNATNSDGSVLSTAGLLQSDLVKLINTDGYYSIVSGDFHNIEKGDAVPSTIALDANTYFPTVQLAADGNGFDRANLKKIGVVVYKAYLDPAEGNKVSLEAVESFAGSLDKNAKDPNTGITTFIDTIINSQSQYINFFSNCFNATADRKSYDTVCDILTFKPGQGHSIGFYQVMTEKNISIAKSIYDGMNKCFDKVADINERDIDIVADAGISNIAQYLKSIYGGSGAFKYDLNVTDDQGNSLLSLWKCQKLEDASTWKTVIQKLDNFCKNVRKDCMFITECPRPLVLAGQKKIVRPSKPSNTIDANILPYIKWVTGLNTNYGAGYLDWFQKADEFTGDFFWCPPSIQAMGVYINTDVNFNYWDAPAGLNRGLVAATDVAFSPNAKQAGCFYEKNWNFAINYPNDGIVLEG